MVVCLRASCFERCLAVAAGPRAVSDGLFDAPRRRLEGCLPGFPFCCCGDALTAPDSCWRCSEPPLELQRSVICSPVRRGRKFTSGSAIGGVAR